MEVFLGIGILLLVARGLEEVFGRLRLPPLLGNVAAGIVLGAPMLGVVSLGQEVRLFSDIGLFLFFFFIGLEEVDIDTLLTVRRRVILAAVLAFAVPFGLSIWLFRVAGINVGVAVGLASVVSIASLSVVARVLSDIGRLRTPLGLQVFAAVAVMELVGIIVFSVALEASVGEELSFTSALWLLAKICLFFVVAWVLANRAIPPLMRWTLRHMRSRDISIGLLFGAILLFVFFGERSGIHGAIGAMLLGMALSEVTSEFYISVFRSLRGLAFGVFVPLFFATAGLEFNWSFAQLPVWMVLGVLSILLVARPLSALAAATVFRLPAPWLTAVGMMPKGSMELALLVSLVSVELISPQYYSMGTVGVLAVLVVSPLILVPIVKRAVEPSAAEVAGEITPSFARMVLGDTVARDVMEPAPAAVSEDMPLSEFIQMHVETGLQRYPVTDSWGRLVGSISVSDASALPRWKWQPTPVHRVMNRRIVRATPDEPLFSILEKMAQRGFPLVVVAEPSQPDQILGVINRNRILERLAR